VLENGYHLGHLDSTVILERPNLKDYRLPIREKLAVGEGRSAEAQAIVTLERRDWAGGISSGPGA